MNLPDNEIPDSLFSSSVYEAAPGIYINTSNLKFTFSRSSGPGGQNVNKVCTKAQLKVNLNHLYETGAISNKILERLIKLAGNKYIQSGELVITAQNHRNQIRNKRECLSKLRNLLIQAQNIPAIRRRTKPTRASIQARLQAKKYRANTKTNRQNPNIDLD